MLLLSLASASAFLANRWFRQRNLATHRFLYGEVALNLAQAALEEADWSLLSGQLARPDEEAAAQLVRLPAPDIDWTRALPVTLESRLTEGLPGGASVAVMAQLAGFEPLAARPFLGIQPDPVEKRGRLVLMAEATYGGLTRRVIVQRDVIVFSLLPPVVSRFALFCRGEPPLPDDRLNSLDYDAARRTFASRPGGKPASPLVVYGSPEDSPGSLRGVVPGGGLSALAPDASASAAMFQRNGWTFLGGPAPWVMNLTLGPGVANPLEEGHLLRRTESILECAWLPGFQEKAHLFGFSRGILDSPIFNGRGRQLETEGGAVGEGTSALRLSGDLSRATPTVVLGRVYRRYLRFSKLRKGVTGPFEAFTRIDDEAAFAAGGDRFAALTGRGYDDYVRTMPRPVVEPYNRSHDYLITNAEESEGSRPYRIRAGDTPFSPAAQLTGARVGALLKPAGVPRAFFLYPAWPPPAGARGTPVRIERPAAGGRPALTVFAGDLDRLDRYADLLASRATCTLERGTPAAGLARFLRTEGGRPELALPGIVHLGAGDLELPRLTVRKGGTLIVEGSVTLAGGIETAAGEPLVLVSQSGDIAIASSERIRAVLIAPAGRILFPERGGADILGAVMTASLDNLPEACAGGGALRITWDPALDCLDGDIAARAYRIAVGPRRDQILERKD